MSDTVFFKHKYTINPSMTPTDAVIAAADKMAETLLTCMHPNMTKTTIQALKRLKDIFQEAANTNKSAISNLY